MLLTIDQGKLVVQTAKQSFKGIYNNKTQKQEAQISFKDLKIPSAANLKAYMLPFTGSTNLSVENHKEALGIIAQKDSKRIWNLATKLCEISSAQSKELKTEHLILAILVDYEENCANELSDFFKNFLKNTYNGFENRDLTTKFNSKILIGLTTQTLMRELKIDPKNFNEAPVQTPLKINPELQAILKEAYDYELPNKTDTRAISAGNLVETLYEKSNKFSSMLNDMAIRQQGSPVTKAVRVKPVQPQVAKKPQMPPVTIPGGPEAPQKSNNAIALDSNIEDPLPRTPITEMHKIPAEKLKNIEHFDQKAQEVAIAISSIKNNAILTHDHGSMPEQVALNFVKRMNDGKSNIFKPGNTEVLFFDADLMLKKGNTANTKFQEKIDNIDKVAREHPDKQYVIFIKDFGSLLEDLNKQAHNSQSTVPATFFNNDIFQKNVHLVGMMQKSIYDTLVSVSDNNRDEARLQKVDLFKTKFEQLDIGSPSSSLATKILDVEKNPELFTTIAKRFPGIKIEQAAVNEAIERSMRVRSGSLPGKAIEFLSFVAGYKANSTDRNDTILTKDDVVKFLRFHPVFKSPPESSSGQFRVIYDTGVTLDDVGGAKQAKRSLQDIVDFIKKPEIFAKTGAKIPKGVLLKGTPGNGKTLLAKAIAGEAGVPFISVSGSDFVEKYVGVGAARVRELFEFARQQARDHESKKAFVFIDEIDAVARSRSAGSESGSKESESTLNQLLVEMDGLGSADDDVAVVVLAATNRPELLDDAIMRPGRFDYKVDVPNPAQDVDAREEILAIHLKGKTIDTGDKITREEVIRKLAESTSGCSGATLADIVNKAAINAAKAGTQITLNHLYDAKLETLAGKINELPLPVWAKKITAAHELGHGITLEIMNNITKDAWNKPSQVDFITLDSRGNYGGAMYPKPGENQWKQTFESVFSEIVCCLGGAAVETELFNIQGSSGISQDLKQAREQIKRAVKEYGMGPNTDMVSSEGDPFVEDMMKPEIKKDLKLFIHNTKRAAKEIVSFYKPFIVEYVEKYEKELQQGKNNNFISGDDLKQKLSEWATTGNNKQGYNALITKLSQILEETKTGQLTDQKKVSDQDLINLIYTAIEQKKATN